MKQDQLDRILDYIEEPKSDLDVYNEDWKFVFAVIMSSQTKDTKVNEVSPGLFEKFPTLEAFKNASVDDVAVLINSIPFYKTKAANLIKTAKSLLDDHKGLIPDTLEKLILLSGIGRKVGNVILNVVHDKPGIVVDTHTVRVTNRLGWVDEKSPLKIEISLGSWIPSEIQSIASNSIVLFGRYTCKAKKPLCLSCPLVSTCLNKQ